MLQQLCGGVCVLQLGDVCVLQLCGDVRVLQLGDVCVLQLGDVCAAAR